jgi:hypothetical protein
MERRVSRLIEALSPVMNSVQAEGFLDVTAFTCNKQLERLSADDWPQIEAAVREALEHTPSSTEVDHVLERMREAFLDELDGSKC